MDNYRQSQTSFHTGEFRLFVCLFSNATKCPLRLRGLPHPGCGWSVTDFWGWDTQYVVPMRMMVRWEVNLRCQGGALNLISTNYPDHGHHGRLPLSRKNAHGRAGNRTRDLMVSSQELWPPSHEAGYLCSIYSVILIVYLYCSHKSMINNVPAIKKTSFWVLTIYKPFGLWF